jgi:NADPH:quinone reductase-like Zn-dependent oxidoreductase
MKAVVIINEGDASSAFQIQDLPTPVAKSNEVLIQVSHFGLNYADVMCRAGLYNDRPQLPCILGYEVVGLVAEKGKDVVGFEKGDFVLAFTMFGGYAEFAVADYRGMVKLAPGTDPAAAAALATQYCTAWYSACHMMNLLPGDRVLVHAAAGGVGTALVQIAKWKGCEVFGTASQPRKLDYLKKQGVDHAINYTAEPFEEAITKILGNERIDAAFDPVGGTNFKKTKALLGSGGRIVTFGASEWSNTKGNIFDKIKLAFGFGFLHPIGLLMKSQSVIGVNMLRVGENKPHYLQKTINEVYEHYQKGILKPTVDSVYEVANIAEAHAKLESRDTIGKVVVKW